MSSSRGSFLSPGTMKSGRFAKAVVLNKPSEPHCYVCEVGIIQDCPPSKWHHDKRCQAVGTVQLSIWGIWDLSRICSFISFQNTDNKSKSTLWSNLMHSAQRILCCHNTAVSEFRAFECMPSISHRGDVGGISISCWKHSIFLLLSNSARFQKFRNGIFPP